MLNLLHRTRYGSVEMHSEFHAHPQALGAHYAGPETSMEQWGQNCENGPANTVMCNPGMRTGSSMRPVTVSHRGCNADSL